MVNGWFVFAVVTCIVISCGFILALVLMRAAWAQRERESLSSDDLRVLEESAVLLIEQLKAEADQRLAAMEEYTKRIENLLLEADAKIAALNAPREIREYKPSIPMSVSIDSDSNISLRQFTERTSQDADCVEIARSSGMDCAEVKLMKRLASLKAS